MARPQEDIIDLSLNSNDEVTIQKIVSSPEKKDLSLVDFEAVPYSNNRGGISDNSPEITAQTTQQSFSDRTELVIDFTLDTTTAQPGSDQIIRYTVTDGTFESEFSFFHQNGVRQLTPLSRISAEAENGDTYPVDQKVANISTVRNVASGSDFSTSRNGFNFYGSEIEASNLPDGTSKRVNGELIPFFYYDNRSPISITTSDNLSGGSFSIYIVIGWDEDNVAREPEIQFKQGSNNELAELYNNDLDGEWNREINGSGRKVKYNVNRGNGSERYLLEFRYNETLDETVASQNREKLDFRNQSSFSYPENEDFEIVLECDEFSSIKIFDVMVFDEDVAEVNTGGKVVRSSRKPDQIASHLSYLYDIDLRSVGNINHISKNISNHLFFEREKQNTKVYSPGGSTVSGGGHRKYSENLDRENQVNGYTRGTIIGGGNSTTSKIYDLAVDSQGNIFSLIDQQSGGNKGVGVIGNEDTNSTFVNKAYNGTSSNDNIEVDQFGFIYTTDNSNGKVRKTHLSGKSIWTVSKSDQIIDLSVNKSGEAYVLVENQGILKYDEFGNEVWSENTDTYSSIVAASGQNLYGGTSGGVVKKLDGSGTSVSVINSFNSGSSEIKALDYDGEYVYVGRKGGKVEKRTDSGQNQEWVSDPSYNGQLTDLAVDKFEFVYSLTEAGAVAKISSFGNGGKVTVLKENFMPSNQNIETDPGRYVHRF